MKKTINKTRGMTYVELIVVLSIFSVISTIVIFNYKEFQAKVEHRKIIMSKLSKGDKLIDKLTGFEYTYEGYGDTPIIINSDGNPLINANAQVVTPQELIETLDTNYEIIKKPVEQDPVSGFSTNTTFTPTNRPGNLTTSSNTNIAEGTIITNNINTEGDTDNAILFENFVNPNQSEESWDRIAFLGLDYDEQVEKGLIDRETTDHIVYENAKFFLDPKNVAPGTKLEAKVNDSDSTIVYDPSKEVRTETTWGELKSRLAKGDIKTPTGLKLNYNDLVPIDLYIDGKKIPGNIHTKAWV
jgi:prepilin-type N-terminal cleavage/methylation domain-containing protein